MRAFCINLKRRKDRLQKTKERLRDISSLKVEFVEAVDGFDLDGYASACDTIFKYACVLSHIKAIKRGLSSGEKEFLILEDDVLFCKDFDKHFNKTMKNKPLSWWILYLGVFPNKRFEQIDRSKGSKIFEKVSGVKGGFAYILNRESAKQIIKDLAKEQMIFDWYLAGLQRIYNCYTVFPFLCRQSTNFSDLEHKDMNYKSVTKYFLDNV